MPIEISNAPQSFANFELSGWESYSQGYNEHFLRLTSQSAGALLDSAAVEMNQNLLDVCCGPGTITATAMKRGVRATGIDFSSEAVKIARSNLPEGVFQEGDAQSLSFDNNTFDAVICSYGLMHVPNPQIALSEMLRVLKPGGRVAVSTWNAPNPNNGFGLLFGAIKKFADMDIGLPHGPDFFQFSNSEKMKTALEETGFTEPSTEIIDQFWEFGESDGFFNAIMEGTIRSRPLVESQSDDVKAAIFEAVVKGVVEHFAQDGAYRIPMPALIGSARKV